jgi:hypothetical protein
MKIIIENQKRILIKDNEEEVNINDGDIIQYTGIYYKLINDIVEMVEIEITFVGIVDGDKGSHHNGTEGIYVKPLYIWNKMKSEWNKIINLEPPKSKYFFYPHLLMLPQYSSYSFPLYYLHTCENRSLSEYLNITKTISLDT